MTQKEKLVELLENAPGHSNVRYKSYKEAMEDLADYLLKNGVIVPIFQIGEKVFVIDTDDEIRGRTVSALFFRKKVCVVYTCGSGILGTVYEQSHPNRAGLYRTREAAEKALKERETT